MTQTYNDFPKLGINTQELLDEVERLLQKAHHQRKEDMGGVNWGDLSVHDIEYRYSMMHPQDGPCCVVTIEEADSGSRLASWLNERLDKKKFPNTYVECDW